MVRVKNRLNLDTKRIKQFFSQKKVMYLLIGTGAVFVAVNAIVFVTYKNRTFPNTRLAGSSIGSVSFNALPDSLSALQLLPSSVKLRFQKSVHDLNTAELGIAMDINNTVVSLSERHWLPVANFFVSHDKTTKIKADDAVLQKKLQIIAKKLDTRPSDSRIIVKSDKFKIVKSVDGTKIDVAKSKRNIIDQIGYGSREISLDSMIVKPKVLESELKPELEKLQSQQKTIIIYSFDGKTRQISSSEIAGLYAEQESSLVLSDAKIQGFVSAVGAGFGIQVKNISQVTGATKTAIENNKKSTFVLVAAPKAVRTFTYCTAVKGVSSSYLGSLESKLQSVFADKRGWSVGGQILFRKVDSGCNFTVWLSAANLMSTFGAICDSSWSCAVSPNVILNFDRWQGASFAWNQKGGSLDDYRSMVINHETGHWLGFGHAYCAGAGQKAPVMQQQSISLQGCAFNSWPLSSEQAALKRTLGI